jgi:hypothetical protein
MAAFVTLPERFDTAKTHSEHQPASDVAAAKPFSPLYGAFLVKRFKQSGALFFDRQFLQSGALFFDRQFLCSIRMQSESPSLLIEPGFTHAGARRSGQGWPS